MLKCLVLLKCHWFGALSVSATENLCPSWTVYVSSRKSLSLTDSLCLSPTFCFCHRQSVSNTHSLCRSQKFYVCHRQSVYVSNTLVDNLWSGSYLFSSRFVHEILVCPLPWYQRYQLSRTLPEGRHGALDGHTQLF